MAKVSTLDIPADRFTAIFGPKDAPGVGKSRLCRTCGGWHAVGKPWPHNCRPEAPPRSPLAAPQIAPTFEAFRTGVTETGVVINDRREKREHMARNDLVEYDEGISLPPEPTDREWREQFVTDLKQVMEMDPLNRPPIENIGQTDMDGADDIDTADIKVFK